MSTVFCIKVSNYRLTSIGLFLTHSICFTVINPPRGVLMNHLKLGCRRLVNQNVFQVNWECENELQNTQRAHSCVSTLLDPNSSHISYVIYVYQHIMSMKFINCDFFFALFCCTSVHPERGYPLLWLCLRFHIFSPQGCLFLFNMANDPHSNQGSKDRGCHSLHSL